METTLNELLTFREAYPGLTSWSAFLEVYSTDSAFKTKLKALASKLLNSELSQCRSCYHDAYIRLMLLKQHEIMDKIECDFGLRAGALLRGETVDQNMTNLNTTNELSLYHLRRDPRCIKFFYKVPDNLDELLGVQPEAETDPKPDEQAQAEQEVIDLFTDMLKEGASDELLAESVSDQTHVGTVKLTKKKLAALIAQAREAKV